MTTSNPITVESTGMTPFQVAVARLARGAEATGGPINAHIDGNTFTDEKSGVWEVSIKPVPTERQYRMSVPVESLRTQPAAVRSNPGPRRG